MTEDAPEVAIPEDEQAAIEMVAEDSDGELTEEEKDLIVAQAPADRGSIAQSHSADYVTDWHYRLLFDLVPTKLTLPTLGTGIRLGIDGGTTRPALDYHNCPTTG